MSARFHAPTMCAAVGFAMAGIAAAEAGSDVPKVLALDAATPMAELIQLCRDGSAESPARPGGVDVDVILQRNELARAACDRLVDASSLEGNALAEALLDRADLHAPGQNAAYARALADYARAIALAPDLATAYWRRGKANLLYARDLTAALQDLNEALRIDPSRPEFLVTRASILGWLGQPDPALADLDRALSLDPLNVHALTNRGIAYVNKGDTPRALVDFDAALRLTPEDPGLYGFRSDARRRTGDEAGAKADQAKMTELMFGKGQ